LRVTFCEDNTETTQAQFGRKRQAEILELLDQEFKSGIAKGDLLGAGEWLASMLDYRNEQPPDQIVARILALWASVADLPIAPSSMKELIANLSLFEHENLCEGAHCVASSQNTSPPGRWDIVKDLCFRIAPDISAAFSVRAIAIWMCSIKPRPFRYGIVGLAKRSESVCECAV